MRIFISWSGERSRAVAAALRDWLPLVLQDTQPYMSSEDIRVGSRWGTSVGEELEATAFGVLCLTPENQAASWVHFEAGAIGRSFGEGRVAPLLLDLRPSDLTGPLSQFQACTADRDGIRALIRGINHNLPQPLEEAGLAVVFDALWPTLKTALDQLPPASTAAGADQSRRPERDVLEEILELVRARSRRDLLPVVGISEDQATATLEIVRSSLMGLRAQLDSISQRLASVRDAEGFSSLPEGRQLDLTLASRDVKLASAMQLRALHEVMAMSRVVDAIVGPPASGAKGDRSPLTRLDPGDGDLHLSE